MIKLNGLWTKVNQKLDGILFGLFFGRPLLPQINYTVEIMIEFDELSD